MAASLRKFLMVVHIEDDLDLAKIDASGQCFRWRHPAEKRWIIPAFGKVLQVEELGNNEFWFECTPEEFESVWKEYLDLQTSYRAIRTSIPDSDLYMKKAADLGAGIRILRQDPWETLGTFIMSQRKNIPAIRQCVERLCSCAGDNLGTYQGEKIFTFPSPEAILGIRCRKISPEQGRCSYQEQGIPLCGLGYRMPYVRAAAAWAAAVTAAPCGCVNASTQSADPDSVSGPESVQENTAMPNNARKSRSAADAGTKLSAAAAALSDEELLQELMKIKGVGIKVASCTALFGFHRTNAFPVDVWMKRALSQYYPSGFDPAVYAPYAGIMQQYMFFAVREEAIKQTKH